MLVTLHLNPLIHFFILLCILNQSNFFKNLRAPIIFGVYIEILYDIGVTHILQFFLLKVSLFYQRNLVLFCISYVLLFARNVKFGYVRLRDLSLRTGCVQFEILKAI